MMKIDWFQIAVFVIGLTGFTGFIFGITWLTVWIRDRLGWTKAGQALGVKAKDMQRGQKYKIVKPFTDFHGGKFEVGEVLTYQRRDYLPYHGGHTIMFEERNAYFQEIEDAQILQELSDYFEEVN